MPKIPTQWLVCPLSQYRLAKESFDQFLDHNIIFKSSFIDFNPSSGRGGVKLPPPCTNCFLDKKIVIVET